MSVSHSSALTFIQRALLGIGLLIILGGCGHITPRSTLEYDPSLISDVDAFGHTLETPPAADLLGMSEGMNQFVEDIANSSPYSYGRFKRLMRKLQQSGHFDDAYERAATYVAAEAFDARTGNCLAYTSMFVALARAVGLNASFQMVETPPVWDVEAGLLVRNKHVNVRMLAIATPDQLRGSFAVDFNDIEADESAPTELVSDEYALSLYYGNVAIDHLQAGEFEQAFAYLRLGIETEPRNLGVWNNMGTLYSVMDMPDKARRVYDYILSREPRNKTAIAGMANALQNLGDHEAASSYAEQTRKSRRRNPYYHYALAEQAYKEEAFQDAMAQVNKAIRLYKRNPRFYYLQAATAHALGDDAQFQKSIGKLKRFKDRRDLNVLRVRGLTPSNS